jgi:hypothetical protein
MDYTKEADKIHADYQARRIINSAYQDAVISFLWLIARLMIERRDRETPSVVPEKKSKK